jgi:putative membrane protein
MVATPLAARGGPVRRVLSSVVVVGSCATTLANATRRWGLSRSVGAAATVAVATTLVEHVGSSTGRPFGRYRYTEALRPQVAGVPVVVPMAWFAMALPARESAHGALGALGAFGAPGRRSTRAGRVALGSAALTAWDLFLDPQMVAEGYWVWARRGAYRGIPLTNYLGWFLTGLGVMAILEALLPAGDQAEPALVAEYGVMGVMETIGFARFFRDPVVAAAGAIGMLPIAAAAHVAGSRGGA